MIAPISTVISLKTTEPVGQVRQETQLQQGNDSMTPSSAVMGKQVALTWKEGQKEKIRMDL